jgi:hypothetical protein
MADVTEILTHEVDALDRLLQQDKDSLKLRGIVSAFIQEIQVLETLFIDLRDNRRISNATGATLDKIGAILGVVRYIGETDEAYRLRIQTGVVENRSKGTPESLIKLVQLITGADTVSMHEGAIASFEFDVQNPDVLTQDEIDALYAAVRRAKAAGVRFTDIVEYFGSDPFTFDGGELVLPLDTAWQSTSISDNSQTWNHLCRSEELGIFVACATGGTNRIGVSEDGLTWVVYPTSDATAQWNAICWSPELGLFVVVSASSTTDYCATSPDGRNWTSRTLAGKAWRDVCWSPQLRLFVAVASTGTGRIATSPDGITWTIRTAPDEGYFGVCWSPELTLFVAVVTTPSTADKAFVYSSDGITWTNPLIGNVPAGAPQYRSVAWSKELSLFVAMGTNAGSDSASSSPDGQVWTARTMPATTWNRVGWFSELASFVAVSSTGSDRIQMSFDGINWSEVYNSFASNSWRGIAYSKVHGRLVSVASTGTNKGSRLYLRQVTAVVDEIGLGFGDLITDVFVSRTPSVDNQWRDVAWSPELGLFAAVAMSGTLTRVMTSPDGIFWTTRTSTVNENAWDAICWANTLGLFVATATSLTNKVMTSPDGITWTDRVITSQSWIDVCWAEELGLLVAVANTQTNRVATSTDGINWTNRTPPSDQSFRCITYAPELNRFVALASDAKNNIYLQSADFTNAAWQLGGTVNYTRTADVIAAPDSSVTADLLVPTLAASSFNTSCPTQEVAKGASAIGYTASVYVKDNGAGGCRIRLYFDAAAANAHNVIVDLVAGTINSTFSSGTVSGATSSIEALANGWFRISVRGTSDTSIIVRTQIFAYGTGGASFTGDGVRGIYLWGAQLESTLFLSQYIPTTTTASYRPSTQVIYSSDGVNWLNPADGLVPIDGTNPNSWFGVAWSPELGLFSAVAGSGTNRCMTSPDGITWTAFAVLKTWSDIVWAPGAMKFFSVASSGTDRALSSVDGSTWVAMTVPVAKAWNAICFAPELGLLVAVAFDTGLTVMTNKADSPEGGKFAGLLLES